MHLKMLIIFIYTILFYHQAQAIMFPEEHSSKYHENQLTKTVIKYVQFMDPVNLTMAEPKDINDEWISLEVLRSFRHGLRIVLEQLSNLHYSQLPDPKDAYDDYKEKSTIENEVSLYKTSFEIAVCSFVPRCLDFINNIMDYDSTSIDLYQLHKNICVFRPYAIRKQCTKIENTSNYLCNSLNVLMIHKLVRGFPEVLIAENYEIKGEDFLLNAFQHVNSINKIRMLKKFNVIPKVNIFKGAEKNIFITGKKFSQYEIDDKRTMQLNQSFLKLNSNYDAIYPENFAENLATLSVPDAVNRMFTRALKTLEIDFRYKIYNLYDNAPNFSEEKNTISIHRSYVETKLAAILDDLCVFTALILVYLTDNIRPDHMAQTAVPFGLHLTICSNWMKYLKDHCPLSSSEVNEQNCVVNAILDKLVMNYFSITGDVSKYDDSVPDYKLAEKSLEYIENIYHYLVDYYNDMTNILKIWTPFDWLTGRHLFSSVYNDSPEMSKIQTKPIILAEKNGNPATEVSLVNAFDILLPWHLNVYTVLDFHAILVGHIDDTMDDFVYRHFKCILLYFQYVNYILDKELLDRLSMTILWYTKGTEKFREFLSLPGPQKQPKKETTDVVSAIKNLKNTTNTTLIKDNAKIIQLIPYKKLSELSDWANLKLFNTPKSKYVNILNRMLMKNCTKASAYTNKFLSTVYQSNVLIKEETSNMYEMYCVENVEGVFVD